MHRLYEGVNGHESLSIKTTRLNAFTLKVLGAVEITWTQNISRHMMLVNSGGQYTLELFSLPCAFTATTSASIGISAELAHEVQESYAMLFNAWPDVSLHIRLGAQFGIRRSCWCWSCSAYRYRRYSIAEFERSTSIRARGKYRAEIERSEFDPLVVKLSENPAQHDWTPDDFPYLWPRIARLDQHLQTARPWSLWILFRDRRDTMQFWTFL